MLQSHLSLQRILIASSILVIGLGLALVFGEQNGRASTTLPEGRVIQMSGQPAGQNLAAAVATSEATVLYTSRNGGQSWEAAGSLPLPSVQALALSPVNPDVVIAASSSQFLRSQDNGRTWEALAIDLSTLNAAGARIQSVAIDGRDTTHLYIGTNQGLFEFDNQSLVRSGYEDLGTASVAALLVPSSRIDQVYAATARGLLASTGSGWARIPTVSAPVSQLLESNGTVLAATGSNGLYRSLDGGRTWATVPGDLGAQPGVIVDVSALAADLTRSGVLYAATGTWLGTSEMHFTPGSVFVSIDHGSHWQPMLDSDGQVITLPARADRLVPGTTQPLHVQALTDNGTIEAQYGALHDQLMGLNSAAPSDRAWAAAALGWLGDQGAVPALLDHLDDQDAAAGLAVVHALGRLGDTSVVPVLLDQLHAPDAALSGIPGTVRMRAATVLGLLRAEEAVQPLAEVLWNDDTVARRAAADALARIGTPAAAEALAHPLADDTLTAARQVAMGGLEQMGAAAVPALERIVRDDSTPAARRNAAEVLGWIAAPVSTPTLVSALADGDATVRVEAAWALGEIGSESALAALEVTARDDGDPAVRTAASLALSRSSDRAAAVALGVRASDGTVWAELGNLLAPPRGLILLISVLLAALVLWLRPTAVPARYRIRHS